MHQKRLYISALRKIRSGAVYSLFQANGLYRKLRRLDRKLAAARPTEEENFEPEDFDLSASKGIEENDKSNNSNHDKN